MTLEPMYDMQQVADAIGMSKRWVRARVAEGAEHTRFGHIVKFTEAQVEKLKADHKQGGPVGGSITTGRRRSR